MRIAALSTLLMMLAVAAASAADPTGTWLTKAEDALIKISVCGPALCGSIVWLKDSLDPVTGKPATDKKNSDATKRSRPLLGLEVLSALKPSGTPNRWDGRIYSVDDGWTVNGRLTLTDSKTLRVEGCLFGLCRGEDWTRRE